MTDHVWGAHVAHSARHDGTVRHDRLMTLAHGTSSKQGHDVELSPSPSSSRRRDVSIVIYKTSRARLQEEEDVAAPGLSPSLFFLVSSFSLVYPGSFPCL
jgi:hypothetical protein